MTGVFFCVQIPFLANMSEMGEMRTLFSAEVSNHALERERNIQGGAAEQMLWID